MEQKGLAEVKAGGMQVVESVDKAAFQTALEPAYKQFAAKFGQKTLDQITNTK